MILQLLALALSMKSIFAVPSPCRDTLYGSGYVRSPNYPSNYDNNLRCNWTLIANPYDGNIVLQFYAFSTESCCDIVSIYNNSGSLVNQYSGTSVPSTVVLRYTAVVTFTTDSNFGSSGFSIWFSSSAHPSSCSGTLYGSGYLRSPQYPSSYYDNMHCKWTLVADPYNGSLVLVFDAFVTQSCCDFVLIYSSNGTLVDRYSGTSNPGTIVLRSSAVIIFTTDRSVVEYGFSMWFTTSESSPPTIPSPRDNCERQDGFYCASSDLCIGMPYRCNGHISCKDGEDEAGCSTSEPSTASLSPSCTYTLYGSGYVRSSGLNLGYQNGIHCKWTLIANPFNGSLVLVFDAFDTESCCDIVSIYSSNGTLAYRYSGSSKPDTIVLGSSADIIFISNGLESHIGFSIWFSTSESSPPTIPSPRDNCERKEGFYCASSDLCIPIPYRCNGYNSCKDGEDEAGCSIAEPGTASPISSCSGTLYGSGYVQSPDFPSNYENYLRCQWTLIASPYNGTIVLQFYAFNTESCCDFLSIYNSSGDLVNRYSGTTNPSTIVLGNKAVISFTTDDSVVSSGFSIWFSTSDAGRTVTTKQPERSLIGASGYPQAFSELIKSSATELPSESWIVACVYVTALLWGFNGFRHFIH